MLAVVRHTGGDDLAAVVRQFRERAEQWHRTERSVPVQAGPVAAAALTLHASNFDLWHQEDAARRPGADDPEIGRRKRCIDRLNDRRNLAVEDIDSGLLAACGETAAGARLHTETPGRIVDRLSVLSLRIVHARRSWRHDPRIAVLEEQFEDLSTGLDWLLAAVRSGEVGFKLYRQYKSDGQRGYCDLFEAVNSGCGWCRPDVCKLTSD